MKRYEEPKVIEELIELDDVISTSQYDGNPLEDGGQAPDEGTPIGGSSSEVF